MKWFTSIAVASLAAVLGFTSVAFADASFYGRVTAGAVHVDKDEEGDDGSWAFGSNRPGLATRVGFKGDQDLGNGMSAGFQIERNVTGTGFEKRHNLVWLSGGWGKLTLGNQNNPFMNARNWDQTYFYGGQFGHGSSYRHEGIAYSMSNGPFSLNVLARAENGPTTAAKTTTIHYYTSSSPTGATPVPAAELNGVPEYIRVSGDASIECTALSVTGCAQAHTIDDVEHDGVAQPAASPTTRTRTDTPAEDDSSGIDGWIVHAGYDFGVAAVNVAHQSNDTESATERDNTAIGVNGSVGALDWYLSYQTSELSNAPVGGDNDVDSVGGFLGFSMSEQDTVYAYHVSHSADVATSAQGEDYTETIVGYSRDMGPGLRFIAEYLSVDKDLEGDNVGSDTSNIALAIRYVF